MLWETNSQVLHFNEAKYFRADIDKFAFLAEDGYRVLKQMPEGEPAVVPRLELNEKEAKEKEKMAEFVNVPHGPIWM